MERFTDEELAIAKKPQLDITSRSFLPKKYIRSVLADISHSTFENELVNEVGTAEEETGRELQQLIRDNLGTFIESKDAMDAVYSKDRELFTGEALEDITAAFASTQEGCEGLVQPIMDSYMDVQHSKQSHDILEKLFSVLSVPGALYENCGVRVVLSKSANVFLRAARRKASALGAAAGSAGSPTAADADADADADGDNEEDADSTPPAALESNDGSTDDEASGEDAANDGARYRARGALEELGGGGDWSGDADNGSGARSDYLLLPGEELFFWYGTPLARLKNVDAQRHREETVSNHENATLGLRRAMLYMEENYNLEEGTLLAAEEAVDSDDDDEKATTNGSPAVAAAGGRRRVSAVQRSPFTFKYSLALLRAALYLEDQLAEELMQANAADTVFIEDTLSMMMDVSIVTVKLWKFCTVLQAELRQRSNEHALESLRDKLVEGAESAAAAAGEVGGPSMVLEDGSGRAGEMSGGGTSVFTEAARSSEPQRSDQPARDRKAQRRQYHPAQYFISSTRSMHARLTRASAAVLLQEASEWRAKVMMSSTADEERRHARERADREDEGSTTLSYGKSGATYAAALQLSSGMIGNLTDSFVAHGSFLAGGSSSGRGANATDSGRGAEDDLSSMSFNASNLKVSGLVDDMRKRAGDTQSPQPPGASAARAQKHALTEVETHTRELLMAFRTPEESFGIYTTFSIGQMDLSAVLEGSCAQIQMHSSAMLQQLDERSDTEATIMAEGALLNTFAARLSEACMANLEHVVVSYWGGIATTIHGGVFDFKPDASTQLGRMLADLMDRTSATASSPAAAAAAQANPAMPPLGGRDSEDEDDVVSTSQAGRASAKAAAVSSSPAAASGLLESVPDVRFIPVLPHGLRDSMAPLPGPASGANSRQGSFRLKGRSDADSAGAGAPVRPLSPRAIGTTPETATLRELSVQAIRRMTRTASDIMRSLFLAFANRAVLSGYVRSLAQYGVGDLLAHASDEHIELHAAVLVEVIMGQWERMMAQVGESVLRMKVAIGESCSTSTITTDAQVEEVGDLLEELEQLRTSCFRCYTHGIGLLAKAYLTMLPMMQLSSSAVSLEHRVRARLSRDFVSSSLTNKLLNTLSVVLDRTVPLLRRFTEVYDSADLFAAKAEDIGPDPLAAPAAAAAAAAAPARGRAPLAGRRHVLRRRRNGSDAPAVPGAGAESSGATVSSDPVTQLVASANEKLVVAHMEEHEELLQALVSNLFQTFVDMLHAKSQSGSNGTQAGGSGPSLISCERSIVECIADALCLATTVIPVFVENLLSPCVFELVARQHSRSLDTVRSAVAEKNSAFEQHYVSRIGEHCQLAVDAMVSMYLAIPQQQISKEVRESGFAAPLFDWQRLSAPAAASVRPYLSNCIVHIARAHETLNWIHQPTLGTAVTQRLVAHFAMAFVAAFTADINGFEVSLECSADFLLHGVLLMEAEALTVMGVVNAVLDSVSKNGKSKEVLPELLLARDGLQSITQAIIQQDTAVYETMGPAVEVASAASAEAVVQAALPSTAAGGSNPLLQRARQRERMVAAATADLRYMVTAICTHLDDSALLSSAAPSFRQQTSAQVTENIAERLAKRKEGYEMRHTVKQRRDASGRRTKVAGAGAEAAQKKRLVTRRRSVSPGLAPAAGDASSASVAPLPPTPRASTAGDTAAGEPSSDIASVLYHSPKLPNQPEAPARHVVRRRRAPAQPAAEEPSAPAPAAAPHAAAEPAATDEPPARRTVRRRQPPAAASALGGPPAANETAAEDAPRRERRANRFKRANAV